MQDVQDLKLIIQSKVPLIVIESYEELRVLDMIRRLAIKNAIPAFAWSITEGFRRVDFQHDVSQRHTSEPDAALAHIKATSSPGLYVLCDFHPYVEGNPKNVRLLKEIALHYSALQHTVVLLSHSFDVPPEIKRFTAQFELSLPNDEQIMSIVREEAEKWSKQNQGKRVKTDQSTLSQLVKNMRGLTHGDVRRLAHGVIFDDGAIRGEDIPEINKAKFALMDMEGVLSYEYDTSSFAEVGGLENLKTWLQNRKAAFFKGKDEKDAPKGIMLLGIQGSGKSLAAKAVAGTFGIPLLRLDFGALYNKYIGESEKNLREALKLADLMEPAVLWLDEIEKGITQEDSGDQGVSKRILGSLLTWMSERSSAVFIVATSNDISKLPPELVRKGRLDEIFFVDLPNEEVRMSIFKIHLEKRNVDVANLDLNSLAQLARGFSGAEIEQVVVAAIYTSAARQESLQQCHLEEEIARTSPLSVVMYEKVEGLRQWAKERTVPAN